LVKKYFPDDDSERTDNDNNDDDLDIELDTGQIILPL